MSEVEERYGVVAGSISYNFFIFSFLDAFGNFRTDLTF